ncbi:hypothetical protein D3C73_947190 [compost metagenome]
MCPPRDVRPLPSTTVNVRAANNHHAMPTTVAIRLRTASSGQSGGCNGLMPAAINTQENATNTAMREHMRHTGRLAPSQRQSDRSSSASTAPMIKG